jgi:hypothetical protein
MKRNPYRVICCGGRHYADWKHVAAVLDHLKEIVQDEHVLVLLEGGAPGADEECHGWAVSHGVVSESYSAQWALYGKAAGPIRNQAMLDSGADLVIAFPGGKGTRDMVRRAEAEGVKVVLA